MKSVVKKIFLVMVDVLIAAYIIVAFSAFNKPEKGTEVCRKVNIDIADATTNGFIDAKEIKEQLTKAGIYPQGKLLRDVNCRHIEEELKSVGFVRTAECYKNQANEVNIIITQTMPVVRIMPERGGDYYIDDKDCIMQVTSSKYTSDLMIATGNITQKYAKQYVSPFVRTMMNDDFCRNMFEQVNITRNLGVELVPRIGDHIIYLGRLPKSDNAKERLRLIEDFIEIKMSRLQAFYKYGLPVAGWNKYSEINLEFNNQIICKKKDNKETDID